MVEHSPKVLAIEEKATTTTVPPPGTSVLVSTSPETTRRYTSLTTTTSRRFLLVFLETGFKEHFFLCAAFGKKREQISQRILTAGF